jgi:hypothetical protein
MPKDDRRFTSLELLDPRVAAILAAKSPAERLQMAFDANRFVRERLRAHLRHEHADWSEAQVVAEVARRMLWNSSM